RSRLCSGQFTVCAVSAAAIASTTNVEPRTANGLAMDVVAAIIMPGMRVITALFSLLIVGGQSYPPPYPRPGTTALLDNARVQVWNDPGTAAPVKHAHAVDTVVVWTEGRTGHAVFLPAGTVHTTEPVSAGATATIFELK